MTYSFFIINYEFMGCRIVITSTISGYCGFVLPEMRRDLTDGLAEDLSVNKSIIITVNLP